MTAQRFTLSVLAARALLAVSPAVWGQQDRVYRPGVIHQGGASYDQALKGMRDGLEELGLGRLTGIYGRIVDLTAKRFELLKEMVPRLRRVIAFYNPDHPRL